MNSIINQRMHYLINSIINQCMHNQYIITLGNKCTFNLKYMYSVLSHSCELLYATVLGL